MRQVSGRRLVGAVALTGMALAMATPGAAQVQDRRQPQGVPQLPQCAAPVGTVSIQEPDRQWWVGYGLGNPEALIPDTPLELDEYLGAQAQTITTQ